MVKMLETLKRYRTPQVRDLAWAILSAPLVNIDSDVDWPDADWFVCAYKNIEEQLVALDKEPTPLLKKISQRNANRLGFYFEALLEMWCELEPAIELVTTNPQIFREDGSTQGAFDFIVMVNGKAEHWECAIKFYLGQASDQANSPSLWYGPNRQDRLDLKLGHMQSTQLRLSHTAEGGAWLREQNIEISRVRSLVKGCVFYPLGEDISPHEHASAEHNRSVWLEFSVFESDYRQRGRWIHLPRLCWLAPRKACELADQPEVGRLERPAQLSRCENGWEVERIFVVPDGWAKQ